MEVWVLTEWSRRRICILHRSSTINETGPSVKSRGTLPQSVFQQETRGYWVLHVDTSKKDMIWCERFELTVTYIKVLDFCKQNIMINNVEGLFGVENKARTEPLLSRVCSHLCWTAISARVVDLPGRQINWFTSMSGSNDGISQFLNTPSRQLKKEKLDEYHFG